MKTASVMVYKNGRRILALIGEPPSPSKRRNGAPAFDVISLRFQNGPRWNAETDQGVYLSVDEAATAVMVLGEAIAQFTGPGRRAHAHTARTRAFRRGAEVHRPRRRASSNGGGMAERVDAASANASPVGHQTAGTSAPPDLKAAFAAPVVESDCQVLSGESFGLGLRALFPHVWNPKGVRDAFVGYGLNQRKKFLEDKDVRPAKYASAYLRVLYQAWVLLGFGVLPVSMTETPIFDTLTKWRRGEFTKGEVIDTCLRWQESVEDRFRVCKHAPDVTKINAFLLDVRKRCW